MELAQNKQGIYYDAQRPYMNQDIYIALLVPDDLEIKSQDDVFCYAEEVDIYSSTPELAAEVAQAVAARDYEGMVFHEIVPGDGIYVTIISL